VCNSKVPKSLSLSLYYILCMCVYVLEHRVRFYAIHILYICTYTIYIIAWKSENRSLERFETSVSGGAVRKRIVDTFALFDYSKAAEALSVHAHAACTCNGRSRGQMVGGPTSHDLAALHVRSEG